jgi:hypothetical protein
MFPVPCKGGIVGSIDRGEVIVGTHPYIPENIFAP